MKPNFILLLITLFHFSQSIIEYPSFDPYSYNKDLIATVIANGLIVTGLDDNPAFIGQILINKNGVVSKIFKDEKPIPFKTLLEYYPKSKIYDATNLTVIPGAIDTHVHLEYKQGANQIESSDDFYSGSIAALCGGTTTIFDFVEPDRDKKESYRDALNKRKELAKKSVIDYGLHMTINYVDENTDENINDMINFYGVNSFKIYTSYDNIKILDQDIYTVLKSIKKYGGLAIFHSEYDNLLKYRLDECIKKNLTSPEYHAYCHPSFGEDEAISRLIMFAKQLKIKQGIHIVHVTSAKTLPYLESAQKEGYNITGEVTTQNLVLTEDVYKQENAADYICSPPIRPQSDAAAMWKGLQKNIIDFVITDHCPFTRKQRRGERVTPDFRTFYNTYDGSPSRMPSNDSENGQKWWKKEGKPAFFNMPGGVPGIETRVYVTYQKGVVEKRITLEQFVQAVSTKAAKRFRLYPKKGAIIPGSEADIVIFDPNQKTVLSEKTLHQNVDYTPYEGMEINMKIKTIFLKGEIVFDAYHLLEKTLTRTGKFLSRSGFNGH